MPDENKAPDNDKTNGSDNSIPPQVRELMEMIPSPPSNAVEEEEFERQLDQLMNRLIEIHRTQGGTAFAAALSIVAVETGIPFRVFADAIAAGRAQSASLNVPRDLQQF